MADQETQEDLLPKKRRRRTGWKILTILGFLLLMLFLGVFLGFNYFGNLFLRNYLQEKIRVSSNGLYHADFKAVHVNILTGSVSLDSFELIPDTLQYQRLKAQGKMARSLYRISFSSLIIDRVHFRQIYAGKRINFRQLTVERPMISIVGYPDTVAAKRSKWRVIYEDLYPAVSGFFNDFHIDSVNINHGFLFTSFGEKTSRQMTGAYEFSSVLKDVSVNPFSYYNRERVFYSRDIDLIVHNFKTQLADSLYRLEADEIGFSLTKSIIYGKKISLTPNFKSEKIRQVQSGDLFRIDLPAFSIRGVDLYRAMTDREVKVSEVNLTDFFIQVYRHQTSPGTETRKKSKKKITLDGLYTVVAKQLRFIAIDSLHLTNGRFEFYGDVAEARPELRIGKVNLELKHFRLDSLAHLDRSRIFYSRAIELDLERISLSLLDGIHEVNASAIRFSTSKSLIDVSEASIFPNRKKNLLQTDNRQNTMFVHLPRLLFTGIDLKKVFNRRILDFNRLIILEPEIRYTRFRPSKNPDPKFKNPGDFFQTENEDVVYDLLKKYLWVIRGNEIGISQGFVQFSTSLNGREIPVATSSFDLSMQQFLIDSVHGMNEQGYFYSQDFNLDLQSFSLISPDSLKHLQAGHVHIITRDSLIEAENIRVYQSAEPLVFNSQVKRLHPMTLAFTLRKLRLTGLNHKKLFLEKVLKASQIVLDDPSLSIKASNSLRPAGPPEEAQLLKANTFVHTFEIGQCLVRNGAFSYDGEEDSKASYFSLKDIEFSVVGAKVHLPGTGVHDGLIKFDSLQLKVFPLRAVISDSAYALEARSLEVHSYPANITLQGVKVTPLKSWNEMPDRKTMATITIPEIRFNGFYFDRAIFDDHWLLEELRVERPVVEVEKSTIYDLRFTNGGAKMNGSEHFNPSDFIKIPPFIKILAVGKISVAGARVGLILHRAERTVSYSMSGIMFDVTRFRVDSATRSNPTGTPLFNADDIMLSAPGYSVVSSDSLYTYTIGRFGLSTGSASAFVDSVAVIPNFTKSEFSRKMIYSTDRIDLKIPRISLSQVDFRKLVSERQLHVSRMTMADVKFSDYLDKRLPADTMLRPLLPGRMVAGIKFPVRIDTIVLSNGLASYEEQSGDEPGRIFFDRMNATLTGFNTLTESTIPSGSLDLHGATHLMGVAPMEAWFHFQTDHPRDTFTMHASIGELDLTAINPMLSKLLPVSVKRGTASSTEIFQMNANNTLATGMMAFRYHNLAISIQPTKPGTWNLVEPWLLTEVANIFLAGGNPNEDGKLRKGIIYFNRDMSKGFFNFVWKSTLSGIKSSVGVNDKNQREIKKHKKQEK